MSFRRKRKVSAPGRLVSPFVTSSSDRRGSDPSLQPPAQANFFSRRISSYALDKRNSEHATIAEVPIDEDGVFVESLNFRSQEARHLSDGHPHIMINDEDEGYNSPNNTGNPMELPDNPGELTLVFLLSLFVEEAERKIDSFAKSVSLSAIVVYPVMYLSCVVL